MARRYLRDNLEYTLTIMIATKSLKRFVTTYPTSFGALIALIMLGIIVVVDTWFPSIAAVAEREDSVLTAVWCTQALFVVILVRFWPLRRRTAFWMALLLFFLCHTLFVVLYSHCVSSLLMRDWTTLLAVEAIITFFLVPWLTRRIALYTRG